MCSAQIKCSSFRLPTICPRSSVCSRTRPFRRDFAPLRWPRRFVVFIIIQFYITHYRPHFMGFPSIQRSAFTVSYPLDSPQNKLNKVSGIVLSGWWPWCSAVGPLVRRSLQAHPAPRKQGGRKSGWTGKKIHYHMNILLIFDCEISQIRFKQSWLFECFVWNLKIK